jgi:hypothetical protein
VRDLSEPIERAPDAKMNLRCKKQIFLAVFALFISLIANTDELYAQKLRVAYTLLRELLRFSGSAKTPVCI